MVIALCFLMNRLAEVRLWTCKCSEVKNRRVVDRLDYFFPVLRFSFLHFLPLRYVPLSFPFCIASWHRSQQWAIPPDCPLCSAKKCKILNQRLSDSPRVVTCRKYRCARRTGGHRRQRNMALFGYATHLPEGTTIVQTPIETVVDTWSSRHDS